MITKPEGPAQLNTPAKAEAAREAFWAFCEKHAINGAARIDVGASTERIDDIVVTFVADGHVPATSAPSQPAVREWDADPTPQELMAAYDRVRKERDELKQQTAVKDAEIERLNERWDKAARNIVCAYCGTDTPVDIRDQEARLNAMLAHSEVCEKSPVKQMLDAMERAEAAERERDSLRVANARLAADLDAALKAGKDGQK